VIIAVAMAKAPGKIIRLIFTWSSSAIAPR
jgi:hypothetical protein